MPSDYTVKLVECNITKRREREIKMLELFMVKKINKYKKELHYRLNWLRTLLSLKYSSFSKILYFLSSVLPSILSANFSMEFLYISLISLTQFSLGSPTISLWGSSREIEPVGDTYRENIYNVIYANICKVYI